MNNVSEQCKQAMPVKIALRDDMLCLLSGYKFTYLPIDSQYLFGNKLLRLTVCIKEND